MKTMLKMTAAASVLMAVSGCLLQPAGTMPNEKSFAAATTENQLVQVAYLEAGEMLKLLEDRFRAEVPTMINFAFDESTLDGEAKNILRQQAAWIKRWPMVRFKVYGHTDKVGSNAYNNALGMRRARAAVNFLVSEGVPRGRLIAVVSRGESEPLVNTEDRERLNRRTVTMVAGFVKGWRGDDFDGKVAARVYNAYVAGAAE
ncbi:MAG TPA: OmpA family protein [Paracoccaceae bacterium]|nr:OmpA family protein [Paracoccaceae bacterium]